MWIWQMRYLNVYQPATDDVTSGNMLLAYVDLADEVLERISTRN